MKKISLIGIFILSICLMLWAANTVVESGPIVTISAMDSDWTYTGNCLTSGQYNEGTKYESITVHGGTDTGDLFVIKEGSDSGATIVYRQFYGNNTNEYTVYLNGVLLRPVIDYSMCSLSTGNYVILRIKK